MCPYARVQGCGDLLLPVEVRVLVDECSSLGGLAGADHGVFEGRAGLRREGVPGVTKVVEAEVGREPCLHAGFGPLAAEGRPPERGTFLTDEEPPDGGARTRWPS